MDDQSESKQTFQFSYSLDRKQFFRRACPFCGLELKSMTSPADISSILQPIFRKMAKEIGEDPEISGAGNGRLDNNSLFSCPYCGYQNDISEFVTSTFITYIKKFIYREYMLPKINKMFEGFSKSLGGQRKGGGLFSMKISMEYTRSVNPPRPINGPEPPDMKIVYLVCCDKEIKILENWNCEVFCPYCSTVSTLQ